MAWDGREGEVGETDVFGKAVGFLVGEVENEGVGLDFVAIDGQLGEDRSFVFDFDT